LEDCLDQFTAPEWVASVNCSHCAHIAASHLLQTQLEMNNFSDEIQVGSSLLPISEGGIW
jgi:hypothetical protein